MDKGSISKTSANQFRLEDISRTFTNVFDTSLIPKNIEYATEDERVLLGKVYFIFRCEVVYKCLNELFIKWICRESL